MKLGKSVLMGAVLLAAMQTPAKADPAAGKTLFEANSCRSCHYTTGPARENSIADQLAKKGPELWYAGSKFQKPWLEAWLQDPEPIRHMKYNSVTEESPGGHPALSRADAGAVTDYLMSLVSAEVETGVITPRNNPKGRLIFTKKMPCSGCHQFPTKRKFSGGRSGPSLVGAGARLNPDWIYAYLAKPNEFKPVRMMPKFDGLMSERDMQSVSAYVASFE